MGWVRVNLHLVEKAPVEYDSLQESVAIYAWRKRQRIELLNTIALVVASVNPEKAQQALSDLIEEQFPEQKIERERSVERALKIMETERKKTFKVLPMQSRKPRGLIKKINKVLKRGR